MKKLVAILFAALIIGVTPAFAINIGEITADPMAVKGKGVDAAAASELTGQVESGQISGADNETSNITSNTNTESATNNNTAPADDQATDVQVPDSVENNDSVTSTQATDVQVPDSVENNDSVTSTQATDAHDLNETSENLTIPQKDTAGIVMQSTDYSCGPAALATVLQNMGFNSTEQELMVLAGTDTSGTTMHGLAQAAQSKGLSATGMKLSVDELRPNNIVHIILDGEGHYSVVREITNESVRLADPSLGNIVMSREKFNEIYTGNALVITNPQEVNQTAEQANNLTAVEMEIIKGQQVSANMQLTAETMQSIRGRAIWKGVALSVGLELAAYLWNTPRNRWSWQGVGWAIVKGVGLGLVFGKVGIAVAKAVLRKAIRFIPWKWRWRLGLL